MININKSKIRFVNNKYSKYFKAGSLTIEAALLMPAVMACIIFIIFTTFYLHDICIISNFCEKKANSIARSGSQNINSCISELEQEIEHGCICKWKTNEDIQLNTDFVLVKAEGNMLVNNGLFLGVLNKKIFTFDFESISYITDEKQYMRDSG